VVCRPDPLQTNSHYSRQRGRYQRFVLLGLFLSLAALLAGCKKKEEQRLSAAQIHQITRDLASAAGSAAPVGSEIRSGFETSDRDPEASDHLDITLFSSGTDPNTRSEIANIQQSLNAVATRYRLTKHSVLTREGIRFLYLKRGVPTHAISIRVRPKLSHESADAPVQSSLPKLAIILDDLGSDRAAAEAIFALDYPLTISILPDHEHSREISREAHRRGYQVLLHLPMQSVANEKPEAQELRRGMSAGEVSALVDQFLQNVPDAAGVNNHQGSEATSDAALMSRLMPVLRDHHLFYIDSRTTAATVAYDIAESFDVRSAFRNVPFLDDVAEVGAVRKQIELALGKAGDKDEAIAIGHPHPGTLQALRKTLTRAQAQGVRLVFASELVH
jgi:polysaccharide deacetylase 2 family uncharacterized protein YibQ